MYTQCTLSGTRNVFVTILVCVCVLQSGKGCFFFICHFPHQSPIVGGSVAKNGVRLEAFYGSSPPCTMLFKQIPVMLLSAHSPQHTVTHCNTRRHTATHCNTMQHTATHCNTMQHNATHISNAFSAHTPLPTHMQIYFERFR